MNDNNIQPVVVLDTKTSENTQPVVVSTDTVIQNKISTDKNYRYRGLRPYKKGQSGNPKGKPKGTVQIKDVIRKKINKMIANQVADNIISGSIMGNDKKQDRLLKLTGDLNDTPTIAVQNNNLNVIDSTLLQQALQYLKDNEQ